MATTSVTTRASASRTPSPPPGPARRRTDGFNALVLSAGLNWRQAMVLRAYAKYLRQAGSTFSQDYMEDTLRNNVHTTRLLVTLFEARMAPERQRAGREIVDALLEEVDAALDQVAFLDEDRILRSFLTVIKATLRTNFFQEAVAVSRTRTSP
ncbi:hypothetical protein SALBM311S_11725 [Streptomyces alboniger]